ncbi:hypothetical protein NJT12_21320 [Flavobacterium sp. AC]|uniref:Uncharacterized protein n=1 Tax=Flavobacterium azizsancarii TaxID=2961580 RepID=A0ABT4WHZ3_9FLAO|nr:hypothetical protein [Flavobacterium azizsancarii]MDA6072172.1 hypothetical protein [Flavobacterium azizsancarii]
MFENKSGYSQTSNKDLHFILKIFSLCLPILGFLIYAKKKNSEPKAATSACEMAIAGIFIGISIKLFLYAYQR